MARRADSKRWKRRQGATLTKSKLSGFDEFYDVLYELPKATQRNTLKRVNTKAMKPVLEDARSNVPVGASGDLKGSVRIQHKVLKKKGALRTSVTAGGGATYYAPFIEFGTVKMPAQPFLRPAIDGKEQDVIDSIKAEMAIEVPKAAARRAKKLAKG